MDPLASTIVKDIKTSALPEADYKMLSDSTGFKAVDGNQFNVPVDMSTITLIAHRSALPKTEEDVLECSSDISMDGGKSWQHFVSFTAAGGDLLDKNGNPVLESSVTTDLPEPKNSARVIRISMTPMKDITTKVDILCN